MMNITDLYVGMIVRIIEWSEGNSDEDGYNRPDHWTPEMDVWQGEIVTISGVETENEYVYTENDGGQWSWYPWDFEYHCDLTDHNPNMVYRRKCANDRFNRFVVNHKLELRT